MSQSKANRLYLLIDQDRVYVEHYCKQSSNQWLYLQDTAQLPLENIQIKLSELEL